MTSEQQAMLFDLTREWVGILNDEGAAAKMTELKANLAQTTLTETARSRPPKATLTRVASSTVS